VATFSSCWARLEPTLAGPGQHTTSVCSCASALPGLAGRLHATPVRREMLFRGAARTECSLEVYALQQRRGRVGGQLQALARGGLALVLQVCGRVLLRLGPRCSSHGRTGKARGGGACTVRTSRTWLIPNEYKVHVCERTVDRRKLRRTAPLHLAAGDREWELCLESRHCSKRGGLCSFEMHGLYIGCHLGGHPAHAWADTGVFSFCQELLTRPCVAEEARQDAAGHGNGRKAQHVAG